MLTRETILETLRVLKPELVAKYKIRSIGLFGSYARGEQTTKSDVDVLVDVDPVIGLGFVDMADAIEARLGVKTDVVPADGVKPRYRPFIQKDVVYV
jgi:predicted nucleotidyltransferase